MAAKAIEGSNFIDMSRYVIDIFKNLLVMLGVVAVMFSADVFILAVVMAVIFLNSYVNSIAKRVQYENSVQVVPYVRKIDYIRTVCTNIEYGKEVRINTYKDQLLEKMEGLNQIVYKYMKKMLCAQFRGAKVSQITNGLQSSIVYLILGYRVIIEKSLTVGDFSMFFNAINQFQQSMMDIITAITEIKVSSLYFGHFLAYMQLTDDTQAPKETVQKEEQNFREIVFENVSFHYPGSDHMVLNNINFRLHAGEKLSIVGTNGSGKTTLIKLLLRLYKPTQGHIRIDGVDIIDIPFEDYISYFSVVFQDYRILAFSITENICMHQDRDNKSIGQVLDKVDLMQKIDSLPKGTETILSHSFDETGVEFSGGENQKLVLARALYKNAPIVVMDEPTSAMDPIAEYDMYMKFSELANEKTSVYISHRLASCRFCERIIVLANSQIAETGTHNELMKMGGLYYEMYSKQAHYYQDNAR